MRKIAMRCTQEQFESIKDRIPEHNDYNFNLKKYPYLTNSYNNDNKVIIGSVKLNFVDSNCEIHETFDAEIFLKACDSWEEEVRYEYFDGLNWHEVMHPVRIKLQPNYSKEIEALQLKAKENGMKCIINFEKI